MDAAHRGYPAIFDQSATRQARTRRLRPDTGAFDADQTLFMAPDDPKARADVFISFLHERLPWSRFVLSQDQPALGLIDSQEQSVLLIDQVRPRYTFEQISVSLIVWQNVGQGVNQ